jgi:hypothetical protein
MTSSSRMKQHLMKEGVYEWVNILNLSYDTAFSSKKIFCWEAQDLTGWPQ